MTWSAPYGPTRALAPARPSKPPEPRGAELPGVFFCAGAHAVRQRDERLRQTAGLRHGDPDQLVVVLAPADVNPLAHCGSSIGWFSATCAYSAHLAITRLSSLPVPARSHPSPPLPTGPFRVIVANLGDEYPQKHAVHVRPIGERYQLTAGHHRKRAAEKKGLREIWAWVEDMDDEAAFMALATSNAQGELGPLEIGKHAFQAVPPAQGKKGAGLTRYAKRLSKTQQYISQVRSAYEVLDALHKSTCEVNDKDFLDKAQHLAAVHKIDADLWPLLVAKMLDAKWTAADTEHWTAKQLREADAKKWTQQRVAEVLGVARETVRDWFKPQPTTNLTVYWS